MAQSVQQAEFNSFIKGFITEASPLSFPENTTIDEQNFVLNIDGSRDRRLGMDYEVGYQKVNITAAYTPGYAFTSFNWENAGGDPAKEVVVVQVGFTIFFFDANSNAISANLLGSLTIGDASRAKSIWSFSAVDGILIIANGSSSIYQVEFINGNFILNDYKLFVRDLFGLEDTVDGVDLLDNANVTIRPSVLTDNHLYNLRNQTFGNNWEPGAELPQDYPDMIQDFNTGAVASGVGSVFPSNADNAIQFIISDPQFSPPQDRYYGGRHAEEKPATFRAPTGFFIIDVLDRGQSRQTEFQKADDRNGYVYTLSSTLPTDRTPNGATVVTEFAGRVFYSGFSGDVIDGDARSPRLSSYVLFSRLVQDPTDLNKCYQESDPTSKDFPDIVDTDGGFIRLDGAYGISSLVNVGNSLMVVASNGVWMIRGGNNYQFSAVSYEITKISEHGTTASNSLTIVDNTFFFWGNDSIYHVNTNQYGDWSASNITASTIQRYYDNIPATAKQEAFGFYDSYDRKVRWLFNLGLQSEEPTEELVFDLNLGAFYRSVIGEGPSLTGISRVNPFSIGISEDPVTVNGDPVTVNGEPVSILAEVRSSTFREAKYATIETDGTTVSLTFSSYNNTNFIDWELSGNGTDAAAYMITGYLTGGDTMRRKGINYLDFHFRRTEDGFEELPDGDIIPTNQSGCLVQVQWNWANSNVGGKWGREFQAYRYRRQFLPNDASSVYDNGDLIITSQNRIRGSGKAISILIKSEPLKDCRILGWAMIFNINQGM